jgi:hypothetical protein
MSKNINRDLKLIARDLRVAMKREATNVIAIGTLLLEARKQLRYGKWTPWLVENFGASDSSADNYMNAARFARKFPTVGSLKLRPTALYVLGDRYPSELFDRKALKKIFLEAETEWVDRNRAREIAEALRPTFEEEIDDILDGPPPELPPAPDAATVHDVVLPSFDQAVTTLSNLATKSLAKFAGTTVHSADDIRAVADFLRDVADAIDKAKPTLAPSVVTTLRPASGEPVHLQVIEGTRGGAPVELSNDDSPKIGRRHLQAPRPHRRRRDRLV